MVCAYAVKYRKSVGRRLIQNLILYHFCNSHSHILIADNRLRRRRVHVRRLKISDCTFKTVCKRSDVATLLAKRLYRAVDRGKSRRSARRCAYIHSRKPKRLRSNIELRGIYGIAFVRTYLQLRVSVA